MTRRIIDATHMSASRLRFEWFLLFVVSKIRFCNLQCCVFCLWPRTVQWRCSESVLLSSDCHAINFYTMHYHPLCHRGINAAAGSLQYILITSTDISKWRLNADGSAGRQVPRSRARSWQKTRLANAACEKCDVQLKPKLNTRLQNTGDFRGINALGFVYTDSGTFVLALVLAALPLRDWVTHCTLSVRPSVCLSYRPQSS